MRARAIDQIGITELRDRKVWEFDIEHESLSTQDETWVYPVNLPVDDLTNRVVVLDVTLANGTQVVGMLGNIELDNVQSTEQFITLSVYSQDRWFHLARYFDSDYDVNGPHALARFLNLPINAVFPIRYDLTGIVNGNSALIQHEIPAEPTNILTEDERDALILGE